jgi:hypothetical protein
LSSGFHNQILRFNIFRQVPDVKLCEFDVFCQKLWTLRESKLPRDQAQKLLSLKIKSVYKFVQITTKGEEEIFDENLKKKSFEAPLVDRPSKMYSSEKTSDCKSGQNTTN